MNEILTEGQIRYRKYREHILKYAKVYRTKHAEKLKLDRQKYADKLKLYKQKNRDKINLKKREDNGTERFGGMRELVLKRDNYTCLKCGMTNEEHKLKWGREITIDHINGKGRNTPKEKRDNRLENLQTLCLSCHRKEEIRRSKEGL